jgi:ribose transport system ATP-binding protein
MQSIFSNICLPVLGQWTRAGFIRRAALHKRSMELAKQVNLRPLQLSRQIRLLSGGNQQKAIICRWLNSGADILIFDEPTRGVDVGAKQEIYQLIERIAHEGRSVVIVSSELDEVMRLSDRILVMQSGRMSGELRSADFSEAAIMTLAIPRDLTTQPS